MRPLLDQSPASIGFSSPGRAGGEVHDYRLVPLPPSPATDARANEIPRYLRMLNISECSDSGADSLNSGNAADESGTSRAGRLELLRADVGVHPGLRGDEVNLDFPGVVAVVGLDHAHAVEMAREGVPLNVIKRQRGQADLGVTSVYLQGIDNTEVISTVRSRLAPTMPASADWSCRQRFDARLLVARGRNAKPGASAERGTVLLSLCFQFHVCWDPLTRRNAEG
jgi:hypothetical protein